MFHEGIPAVLLLTAPVSSHRAERIGFLCRRMVLKLKYRTAAESFSKMQSKNTNGKHALNSVVISVVWNPQNLNQHHPPSAQNELFHLRLC